MIYGTRAVIEAIAAGKDIDKIMIQSGLTNDLVKELIAKAREHNVPIAFVPAEKLKRLSTKNHQGVICILSSVSYASVDNLIFKAYQEGREPFFLILDRITDVRNFGAIVRTAECAGMTGIIIAEKGNAPITSDAMKTSAGALMKIPVCRHHNLKNVIEYLKESGLQVVGCTEKTDDHLYDVDLTAPTCIIMGNEEEGISPEYLKRCTHRAKIPMTGSIESLNVSVSAGIILYETLRQRMKA